MLEKLHFTNVGPAAELEIEFSRRLNFIAGDNGLGKTFLLDASWWALTRTWAQEGRSIAPQPAPATPSISYRYGTKAKKAYEYTSTFDRSTEEWPGKQGRPPIPGLVIYAQVDGGFSVWDPARNYWKKDTPGRPNAYRFEPDEVWNGLPLESSSKLCNGLIADWALWQLENGEAFAQLCRVLDSLSPSSSERLSPGKLAKVSVDDSRRHPTIKMPYGQDVALVHSSAGMRRIVALAYLLVWTWQEHLEACKHQGIPHTREIIFLIDEIEAHLHPQWQRRIVPALLNVMEALTGESNVPVQLITATHSPLVLASAESRFDEDTDAIWELDLVDQRVRLRKAAWERHGDANAWLTSSVFDLREARSVEAEEAITEALELLRTRSTDTDELGRVDGLLKAALGELDRFWVRWSSWRESEDS